MNIKRCRKSNRIKIFIWKNLFKKRSALKELGRIDEALSTFKAGLEKEPENVQLKLAIDEIEAEVNNPFLKNYPYLFTDLRTVRLMTEPKFKNLFESSKDVIGIITN